MHYKIIFSAVVNGKKQNLDTTFESEKEPTRNDPEVIRAAMQALSHTLESSDGNFSIAVNIEAIVPVV